MVLLAELHKSGSCRLAQPTSLPLSDPPECVPAGHTALKQDQLFSWPGPEGSAPRVSIALTVLSYRRWQNKELLWLPTLTTQTQATPHRWRTQSCSRPSSLQTPRGSPDHPQFQPASYKFRGPYHPLSSNSLLERLTEFMKALNLGSPFCSSKKDTNQKQKKAEHRAMPGRGPDVRLLVVLSPWSHEWCYFLPVMAIVLSTREVHPSLWHPEFLLGSVAAWLTFSLLFLQVGEGEGMVRSYMAFSKPPS